MKSVKLDPRAIDQFDSSKNLDGSRKSDSLSRAEAFMQHMASQVNKYLEEKLKINPGSLSES